MPPRAFSIRVTGDDNPETQLLEPRVYALRTHRETLAALVAAAISPRGLAARGHVALMQWSWNLDGHASELDTPIKFGTLEGNAIAAARTAAGLQRVREVAWTLPQPGDQFLDAFVVLRAQCERMIRGEQCMQDAVPGVGEHAGQQCPLGATCVVMWNGMQCGYGHSAAELTFAALVAPFQCALTTADDRERLDAALPLAESARTVMYPWYVVTPVAAPLLAVRATTAAQRALLLRDPAVAAVYNYMRVLLPHFLMGDGHIGVPRIGICGPAMGCDSGAGFACMYTLAGRECRRRHTTMSTLGTRLLHALALTPFTVRPTSVAEAAPANVSVWDEPARAAPVPRARAHAPRIPRVPDRPRNLYAILAESED